MTRKRNTVAAAIGAKIEENMKMSLAILPIALTAVFSIYLIFHVAQGETATQYFQQDQIEVTVSDKVFTLDTALLKKDTKTSMFESPNVINAFLVWLKLTENKKIVEVIDREYVELAVQEFEQEHGMNSPQLGKLSIDNGEIIIRQPKASPSVNVRGLLSAIYELAATAESDRSYFIATETDLIHPRGDTMQFNNTVKSFMRAVSSKVTLVSEDKLVEHVLLPKDLLRLLQIEFDSINNMYSVKVDEDVFIKMFSRYLVSAQDAQFKVKETNVVEIIPSVTGNGLVTDKSIVSLLSSLDLGNDTAVLYFEDTLFPEFNTQDAANLNINHMVSSFTTYYSCCQDRTKNIQNFSDIVDGAIVMPGEQFNLNEYVGKRTVDRGFKKAGTLINGTLIETVGGGVSQFATTFFNAVYWGGYEDVTHFPHSRYFSRYPKGIEATISWPVPDLIFRNDTDSGLLINTYYTDNSITVEFYGDNDSRIVSGSHRYKKTNIDVLNEGGVAARIVNSVTSDPYNEKEPKEVYRVNKAVSDEQVITVDPGREGYTLNVDRLVTQNEKEISKDRFKVTYLSEDVIHHVSDCQYVPEDAPCETNEDIKKKMEELYEFSLKLENEF